MLNEERRQQAKTMYDAMKKRPGRRVLRNSSQNKV